MPQEKESVFARIDEEKQKTYYAHLHRKFILITLVCSLVPLLLVGWAINIHYTRFAKTRMVDSFETQVSNHKRIIELFLKRSTHKANLIAQTHSKDFLKEMSNLAHVFEIMNQEFGSITDLGVIDQTGKHLAYVGPYDLMDKVYVDQPWFKQVMEKGIYVSDMFTGFRKVPHFIIAVTRMEKGEKWILRATVDTEAFRSLVENVRIGRSGEVYLLNEDGFYQTTPRASGKIMEKADIPLEPFHEGIKVRLTEKSPREIMATAWLKEPRWMLVVKQKYSEAFDEVNYANYATLIFLHLSALTILIVTILVTRHLIKVIKNRDKEADHLAKQLMETGKMASLGELSAGVAHEINNPLAIILTERQILLDLAEHHSALDEQFKKDLKESLDQMDVQVNRCKRITHNLLRFSRRTKSVMEKVNLNEFLGEIVELMEREARSSGIKFLKDLDPNLKPVLSDPSQLQQVFLNLFTNAIDAHDGKPYGTVRITTKWDDRNQRVRITVADTGSGIPEKNLSKIFDPFFTTKPVGRGTGLGLSICYSTIHRLGGTISATSEPGEGTEFTLDLPFNPPEELQVKDGTAE
ncbi:MAG: two-component sensor histidine kinase [Deltaproteobacteria bacterium]|nr:two-component sensor histidine kinase [Deltaproteobacteria bacterium]